MFRPIAAIIGFWQLSCYKIYIHILHYIYNIIYAYYIYIYNMHKPRGNVEISQHVVFYC